MGIISYSALRTKTCAMRAMHLSGAQYDELKSKTSVSDAAAYLKYNTVYAPLFENVSERTLHRGDLERLLDSYLQSEVKKLYSFCTDEQKQILSYTYVRYEIDIIKSILRALYSGQSVQIAYNADGFFAKKLCFNPANAAQSASLRELLMQMKNTPYCEILTPPLDAGADLFVAESALDIYYFKYIWNMKNKALSGKDRQIAEESFGSEIDMKNLCWIYRQKRYYDMQSDLIFSAVIPIHYKIPRALLVKMVETPDVSRFIKLAKTTRYAALFENLGKRFIEQNYDEMVQRQMSKLIQNNPFSVASLIGYTHFLENEIAKIVTAVESIRYGINI